MIKLPIRVGSDLRERVEKSYDEAISQVGETEELYVRDKLPRVLGGLKRGSQGWRSEVVVAVNELFEVYEHPERMHTGNGSPRPMLLAALFYFCNPYDIIPDRVPGTGFADDALVLNDCLRRIEEKDPDLYGKINAAIKKVRGYLHFGVR